MSFLTYLLGVLVTYFVGLQFIKWRNERTIAEIYREEPNIITITLAYASVCWAICIPIIVCFIIPAFFIIKQSTKFELSEILTKERNWRNK